MSRRRAVLVVIVTVASVLWAGGWGVDAQTTTTVPSTTTTADTVPPTSGTTAPLPPTTTTNPPRPPITSPLPPPSTIAPPPPPPALPGPTTTAAPSKSSARSTSTTVASTTVTIPPDVQRLINSIKRTGASSTTRLLDALRALDDFGLTPKEAAIVGSGHFPVAGDAAWSDDFLMPRLGPPFHLHQGNDIFAALNVPVRASYDGVLRYENGGLGGLSAYVTMPDGTYFYMAHLNATVLGLRNGARVTQGQVVGFCGNSGNAVGGATHVHFEIHPKGGPAVNPKPILDRWIAEAIADVPALVAAYRGSAPAALLNTGLTRRFDESGGMFSAPPRLGAGPLLWASSVSAAGGTLRLAEVQAEGAASVIDWSQRAQDQQRQVAAWQEADQQARAILEPLTPAAFNGLL